MERDWTRGSVLGNIAIFSLPFLLSSFLQMFYGLADLFIIGEFRGVESTTAVSVGSQVMHMLTVMVTGLSMGSTVMTGRAVGAKDRDRLNKTVGNTISLFLSISIVLALVLSLFIRPIIRVVKTPAEAAEEARAYLQICFLGIPFIVAYNVISSVLQGMGDTKTPLLFVFIATLFNIAFDYVFIGFLSMGAAGAALGTTLAQAISVLLAVITIRKRRMMEIRKTDLEFEKKTLLDVLRIGVPITLQNGFIQVSFLFVTAIANARGLTDSAAVGIVEKVIGMLFLVPSALLSSVSAISSISFGAGKGERAERTLFTAVAIAVFFGTVWGVLVQFISEDIVSIFTRDALVIAAGGQYLRSYVWDSLVAGVHFSFSGWFAAIGRSRISFMHNMIAIVTARVPLAYLLSVSYPDTLFPMGWATVAGSAVSVLISVICYLWIKGKSSGEKFA